MICSLFACSFAKMLPVGDSTTNFYLLQLRICVVCVENVRHFVTVITFFVKPGNQYSESLLAGS